MRKLVQSLVHAESEGSSYTIYESAKLFLTNVYVKAFANMKLVKHKR